MQEIKIGDKVRLSETKVYLKRNFYEQDEKDVWADTDFYVVDISEKPDTYMIGNIRIADKPNYNNKSKAHPDGWTESMWVFGCDIEKSNQPNKTGE